MTRAAEAPDDDTERKDLVGWVARPLAALNRAPLASYQMIVVVTALLSVIGLAMVLSSSNVLAYSQSGGTPFDIFLRQAIFMGLGWFGFYCALRMRFSLLRTMAWPLLGLSVVLLVLVLVPGIGMEINGSRGWIDLGIFALQPSEIAKVAVIVWACHIVATKMRSGYWVEMLWPAGLGVLVVFGLVLVAPDLGMATIILMIFLCVLWFAGYPARHFGWVLGIGLAGFAILATTMAYRFSRVQTYVQNLQGDYNQQGSGYQTYQGMLSLADGGLVGVGLGQSSAKWYYLPEATNDFIFAIIGEELGWLGAAAVISLYGVLGWAGIRVARRSVDPFRRLLAGTVTASVVLQAAINIGYVVGLLPVTGIQLPLISNGGTSAVMTLFALGLLANCARHEPEAISAILSGPGRKSRWYSLPDPQPYTGEQILAPSGVPGRSAGGASRYGAPVRTPSTARTRRPAPYESMPSPQDRGKRRGAGPVTGRNAPTVRSRRDREPGPAPADGPRASRPTPITRGRQR